MLKETHLHLLRNMSLFDNRAAALASFTSDEAKAILNADGTPRLARYYADDAQTQVKTILGVFHAASQSYTIFDADASSDVSSALQAAIDQIEESVGLNENGSYTPDADSQFISGATNIEDALEKLNAAIEDVIAKYKEADKALQDEVDFVSGAVDTNTANIETVSGQAKDNADAIKALQDADDVLSGKIDDNADAIEDLQDADDELSGKIETNKTNIETVSGNVDTLSAKSEADDAVLSGAIDANKADIEAVSGQAEQNADDIEALSGAVEDIKVKDVKSDDKVLSLDSNGVVSSTLSVAYDSDKKEIYLYGKDNTTPISTIDATDFIKDGMLNKAEIVNILSKEDASGNTIYYYMDGENEVDVTSVSETGKYIHLAFNTDAEKDDVYLAAKDLVSEYTEGTDIDIKDNVISVATDTAIKTYKDVGYLSAGTTIPAGTSLSDIINMIFVKTLYPAAATKPSISAIATTKSFDLVEVGSTVTIPAVAISSTSNGKFNSSDSSWSQPAVEGVTWSGSSVSAAITGFTATDGTALTIENGASVSAKVVSGSNTVKYTATEDYSAPSNTPKTNTGVDTTKTGETASDGSATWVAGTATKTGSTTAYGVYPMFTNGAEGSTATTTAAAATCPTTMVGPDAAQADLTKLALTSGSTFAAYFASESLTQTHYRVYLYGKAISSAMAFNQMNNTYSVDFTSDFHKLDTKKTFTVQGVDYEYDVWESTEADSSNPYVRGSYKILFTLK